MSAKMAQDEARDENSFPENGTKAAKIEWMDEHGDIQDATAIAFCVDASPRRRVEW